MSGPTLQLNITAPGQKSVESSVNAVERLAAALRELPKASAELLKLQQALAGVQGAAAGGLKGAGSGQMAAELKALSAQLNTSFASLEETIKKGWAKAQAANEAGSSKAAGSKGKTVKFTPFGTGTEIETTLSWLGKMQTGSLKIAEAQAAATAKTEAAIQKADQKLQASFMRRFESEEKWRTQLQVTSAQWAETARMAAERQAAAEAAAAARKEAAIQKADDKLQAQFARRYEQEAQWRVNLQVNSAKMAEAAREAAAREAAGQEAWRARLQANSAQWAEAYREAQAKQAAASEAWVTRLKVNSAKMAEAAREAAEKEAAAVDAAARRLDAAYAAMSERVRNRTVLRARTQLDQGVAPEAVQGRFGAAALTAAQATTTAQAYDLVHAKVQKLNPELERGAVNAYKKAEALRDLHSAARGVANGFGQMSLTWGTLGPLLAGAALSNSFVQSIKLGLQARQELEVIRVLSNESTAAVAALEQQMISLGQRGPFGPREVAEAMKTLSLAGLSAQEVAVALKPALDFAVTGGVGIQKASESLVAIGTAYGYQASQFSVVADAVSKSAAISMSSVEGMMESFKASSIVAQAYGVTLKDAATSLALLANIGIKGSAAGTAMRQAYSELSGATASTRKAMAQLGVEVVGTDGKMKSLLTIATDLSKALTPLNGKARISAIQALSNERGSKDIVALLTAVEKKAKDAGSTASNELERIRQLIEESAGFNAIAAAELAASPQNMFKGVVSSFQTALYQAYQAAEPTLILIADRLRAAFTSPEVQAGITGLVKLMANAGAAALEMGGALQALAVGFGVYKGAQVLQLALVTLNAAMVSNTAAAGTAALATAALGASSATATPAVTGLAAAAGLLGRVLSVAGPLALVVTGLAFAWQLYGKYAEDARLVDARAAAARQNSTIGSLKQEAERLEKINDQLRRGVGIKTAEAEATRLQAQAEREKQYQQGRAALLEARDKAQEKVDSVKGMSLSDSSKAGLLRNPEAELRRASAALDKYDQDFTRRNNEQSWYEQVIKSESAYLERARELEERANASKLGNKPWTPAMTGAAAGGELTALQGSYRKLEDEARKHYQQEKTLLDEAYKYKLVTDAEYANRSVLLAEQEYNAQAKILSDFIRDTQGQLAVMRADPKTAKKAGAISAGLEAAQREAESRLEFLKRQADQRQRGAANLVDVGIDLELRKLAEKVKLDQDQLALSMQLANLMPEEIAQQQAINETRQAGVLVLQKTLQALSDVEDRLNLLSNRQGPLTAEEDSLASALQRQKADLQRRLDEANARIAQLAQMSGRTANERSRFENRGQWEKDLESWSNAQKVLKQSRDEFMNGWLDKGRNIWQEFSKTGKLSISSLKDLLMTTFNDIVYKRFIAKPFTDLGEKLFDSLLKPTAVAQSPAESLGSSRLGAAFSQLSNASMSLSDRLSGLGSAFWRLFEEAGRGLAAMFQASGAGSLQSLGNFIGGLFGGGSDANTGTGLGSGSTGTFIPGTTEIPAYALGAAFSNGVKAFAKGAVLTNSILTRPTMFQYGAGLPGVGGEAGPEAVMPLARGAGGELGVRVHGAQSQGAQIVNKTTVIIEKHGSGADPEIRQESGPSGENLIRVIVGKTAEDINRGGAVRKSMRNVLSRQNLPRY